MNIKPTHERMEELLENDDVKSDIGKLRFGLAMFVMTTVVWMSYARIFAERAVRQSGRLLVSLACFAVAVVMYRSMLLAYDRLVSTLIERTIEQARKRTGLGDRAALALGLAVGAGCAYAAYRVGLWAIQPHIERMKMYEKMYGHESLSVFGDEDDEPDDDPMAATEETDG